MPGQAQSGGRGITPTICNIGARKCWVISTTLWLHYPWERPGTHCTGGWVSPRAGLDRTENLGPTGI